MGTNNAKSGGHYRINPILIDLHPVKVPYGCYGDSVRLADKGIRGAVAHFIIGHVTCWLDNAVKAQLEPVVRDMREGVGSDIGKLLS